MRNKILGLILGLLLSLLAVACDPHFDSYVLPAHRNYCATKYPRDVRFFQDCLRITYGYVWSEDPMPMSNARVLLLPPQPVKANERD